MKEKQTCGRRMSEMGPWKYEEGLDFWETDRRVVDPDEVVRRHDAEDAPRLIEENRRRLARGEPEISLAEYRTTCFVRGASNDRWLWPWGPARSCSFCGSVHPDDAFRLLEDGWEGEVATKRYKVYLAPPGTRTRTIAFLASIRDYSREPGRGVPSVWSPTPPVKLYTQHLDDAQLDRLNRMLRESPDRAKGV